MKRDNDLVRKIMIECEDQNDWLIEEPKVYDDRFEEENKYYHIRLLVDAGLMEEVHEDVFRITNSGHDFVQEIRSETNWKKIKSISVQVGAGTLSAMVSLATAIAKKKISDLIGVEVE